MLLMRVDLKLLHAEVEFGQYVLEHERLHVAGLEGRLPRLEHHLGRDVGRVPVEERARQLVTYRRVQRLQALLCHQTTLGLRDGLSHKVLNSLCLTIVYGLCT